MKTTKLLNKLLGKNLNQNSFKTHNKFNNFKPLKETTISGKKVQVFNNNPIPKRSVIKKAYDKIPDDKNIPLQFMTRKQYLNKYIKNQEKINGVDFSSVQEKEFINKRMPVYKNILGRYTTKTNDYYPPAVVVFNDKDNLNNIKGDKFDDLVFHEYGHELAEKNGMKMPLMKEEHFADNVSKYAQQTKIFYDNKAKNYALNKIKTDSTSKNKKWRYDASEGWPPVRTKIKLVNPNDLEPSESEEEKDRNKIEFIKDSGDIIEPIQVWNKFDSSQKYQIKNGHHRTIAARERGDTYVPVEVWDKPDDTMYYRKIKGLAPYSLEIDNNSKNMARVNLNEYGQDDLVGRFGLDKNKTFAHGTSLKNALAIKETKELKDGTVVYPGRGGLEDTRNWANNTRTDPVVVLGEVDSEGPLFKGFNYWKTVGNRAEEREGMDDTSDSSLPLNKVKILTIEGEELTDENDYNISEDSQSKNDWKMPEGFNASGEDKWGRRIVYMPVEELYHMRGRYGRAGQSYINVYGDDYKTKKLLRDLGSEKKVDEDIKKYQDEGYDWDTAYDMADKNQEDDVIRFNAELEKRKLEKKGYNVYPYKIGTVRSSFSNTPHKGAKIHYRATANDYNNMINDVMQPTNVAPETSSNRSSGRVREYYDSLKESLRSGEVPMIELADYEVRDKQTGTGRHRILAARELGMRQVPVVVDERTAEKRLQNYPQGLDKTKHVPDDSQEWVIPESDDNYRDDLSDEEKNKILNDVKDDFTYRAPDNKELTDDEEIKLLLLKHEILNK